ncbi:MAG: hypothetical protein Q8L10_02905 [Candidatus Moranbacteria bacterium]|nr:hypothetical protein [Candidatus Moranbacteria bacterium]
MPKRDLKSTIYLFSEITGTRCADKSSWKGHPFLEVTPRWLPDGSSSQCSAITLDKYLIRLFFDYSMVSKNATAKPAGRKTQEKSPARKSGLFFLRSFRDYFQ